MDQQDQPQLHDLPEAATRLSLTLSTIRGLVARGELGPVVKIGRRILLEEAVIRRFITERRAGGPPSAHHERVLCINCHSQVASVKKFGPDLMTVTVPCACGSNGSLLVTVPAEQEEPTA